MRVRHLPLFMGLMVTATVLFSSTNLVARAEAPAQGGGVGALALLWDQFDSIGTDPVTSQNFPTQYDLQDAEAADDFVVSSPGIGWAITNVKVKGAYVGTGTAVADSVNVRFYNSSGNLPASVVSSQTVTGNFSSGDLDIFLAAFLPNGGPYWLSVQANVNWQPSQPRVWFWTARILKPSTNPSAWRTSDGFTYPACTNWVQRVATCNYPPGATTQVDMTFQLHGFVTTSRVYLSIISR